MTIPSTYRRNMTGGAFTSAKVGGVLIGVTSATDTTNGQPITVTKQVKDNAVGERAFSGVKANTNAGAYNATKLLSSGTFAYGPAAGEWAIRRIGTTLNGTASTVLLFPASSSLTTHVHKREKMFGAKVLTAWRNRGWQPLGVSGQRSNWDANATGVNSGGVLDPLNSNFVSTTDNTSNSDDDAIGTRAVPGSLTFLDPNVTTVNYKAKTGG